MVHYGRVFLCVAPLAPAMIVMSGATYHPWFLMLLTRVWYFNSFFFVDLRSDSIVAQYEFYVYIVWLGLGWVVWAGAHCVDG